MGDAQALMAWAGHMESGTITQGFGLDAGPGPDERCARGAFFEAIGIPARWVMAGAIGRVGIEQWYRLEPAVCREVRRLVPGASHTKYVTTLNDGDKVPFSVFAQAARNVARRLEEQEYGPAIERSARPVVAEREELVASATWK